MISAEVWAEIRAELDPSADLANASIIEDEWENFPHGQNIDPQAIIDEGISELPLLVELYGENVARRFVRFMVEYKWSKIQFARYLNPSLTNEQWIRMVNGRKVHTTEAFWLYSRYNPSHLFDVGTIIDGLEGVFRTWTREALAKSFMGKNRPDLEKPRVYSPPYTAESLYGLSMDRSPEEFTIDKLHNMAMVLALCEDRENLPGETLPLVVDRWKAMGICDALARGEDPNQHLVVTLDEAPKDHEERKRALSFITRLEEQRTKSGTDAAGDNVWMTHEFTERIFTDWFFLYRHIFPTQSGWQAFSGAVRLLKIMEARTATPASWYPFQAVLEP